MAEEENVPENILDADLNDGPIDFESGPEEWYTSGLADLGPFTLEDLEATWTFDGNFNLPLEPNPQALQEDNQILEEDNQVPEQDNQALEQDNQVLEEGSNVGASSRSPPSSPSNNLQIHEGILSIFDEILPSSNPTNNLQIPEGNLASSEGLFPSSQLATNQNALENFDFGEEFGSPTNNFQNDGSISETMFEDLLDPEGPWGRGELFPHLPGHELMEDDQLGPSPTARLDNVNSVPNLEVDSRTNNPSMGLNNEVVRIPPSKKLKMVDESQFLTPHSSPTHSRSPPSSEARTIPNQFNASTSTLHRQQFHEPRSSPSSPNRTGSPQPSPPSQQFMSHANIENEWLPASFQGFLEMENNSFEAQNVARKRLHSNLAGSSSYILPPEQWPTLQYNQPPQPIQHDVEMLESSTSRIRINSAPQQQQEIQNVVDTTSLPQENIGTTTAGSSSPNRRRQGNQVEQVPRVPEPPQFSVGINFNLTELNRAASILSQEVSTQNWARPLHGRLLGVTMVNLPIERLLEAWGHLDVTINTTFVLLGTHQIDMWSPIMFHDRETRKYKHYFPMIIEKLSHKIFGFDQLLYEQNVNLLQGNPYIGWVGFPSLNWIYSFLLDWIIASSHGLLVIDSGRDPNTPDPFKGERGRSNLYHSAWKELANQVRGESALIVCNPLTREYKLLPPIGTDLKNKVAGFSIENTSIDNYVLVVVGWFYDVNITPQQSTTYHNIVEPSIIAPSGVNKMMLIIYSSQQNRWSRQHHIEQAKPSSSQLGGRSGCAAINYNIYFGGTRMNPITNPTTKLVTFVEMPALFYVNVDEGHDQHLVFDFHVRNLWAPIVMVEPPKVVRVGDHQIYAITRQVDRGSGFGNIFLVEVLLQNDGTPQGVYGRVNNGVMPENFSLQLYNSEYGSRRDRSTYEVVGGDNLIAFKIGAPHVVLFHTQRFEWTIVTFPAHPRTKIKTNRKATWQPRDYDFIDGTYEPNWAAKP